MYLILTNRYRFRLCVLGERLLTPPDKGWFGNDTAGLKGEDYIAVWCNGNSTGDVYHR
jgi:hypothetical protein